MTKLKLRELKESTRPKGMSDEEWKEINDGYGVLQSTLFDLAKEIGANYEDDFPDDAESNDEPIKKTKKPKNIKSGK